MDQSGCELFEIGSTSSENLVKTCQAKTCRTNWSSIISLKQEFKKATRQNAMQSAGPSKPSVSFSYCKPVGQNGRSPVTPRVSSVSSWPPR